MNARDGRAPDVVVVGARCAGAATALLLARAGLRAHVLDRSAYGRDTLSTHALMRGGVLELAHLGVLDAIARAGTPEVRRTTFDYGDDRVTVPIKPLAGVGALYAPRRTVLDRLLVDAARAAGARFCFGTTVAGVSRDGTGRVVGVVTRDRDGRHHVRRAGLVVGADGARSVVARAVGAPAVQVGRNASAVAYGYWPGPVEDGYTWSFRDGAASGIIPTNAGTCAFVAAAAATLPGGAAARRRWFDEHLRRAAPASADELAARPGPDRLRGYVGVPGYLRRCAGPGWALVGDAAAYRDPITAHGISDALRDAELLARAVLEVAAGSASEDRAFAGYEAARDALARPIMEVTDAIAGYDWDTATVARLHRRLSSAFSQEVDVLLALHGGASTTAVAAGAHA